jgi:SAM-dependent methyltransferase
VSVQNDSQKEPRDDPREEWVEKDALRFRVYDDYATYVRHQAEKLGRIDLTGYTQQFRAAFVERLQELDFLKTGTTVLCLGARNGAECECFIERGCVAIGIDLNPGAANRYVVSGDFHGIQYATGSFDVVFTNSLDHAFDLDRVVGECRRLLKPGGHLVAEIVRGSGDTDGRDAGAYESCWWSESEAVIQRIVRAGFSEISRAEFAVPWNGDRVVFRTPDR